MDIDEYVELAKTVEIGDPFDWADTPLDEDNTYRLVAMSVLALDLDLEIAVASVIKLCVENLVLNMRLLQK
jgi:hypothetical protein